MNSFGFADSGSDGEWKIDKSQPDDCSPSLVA